MRYFKLLLLAMVAAGPSPASAQELRSVAKGLPLTSIAPVPDFHPIESTRWFGR
jgi:hypothetical protein